MLVAVRTLVAALAIAVMSVACGHHRPAPAATSAALPGPAPVALSQRNLGFTLLAEVDNARHAVELHDAIAAGNDVGQALALARQMINHRPQTPTVLTSFAVRVRLTSARALLTAGNLSGADAELGAIQDAVPRRSLPPDLPLLRAAASLALARDAVSTGGTQRLRTQLQCARSALQAYHGPGHIAEARDLASTLDRVLADPAALKTLLPYQLSLWLGKVAVWAGSSRWQ